MREVTSLVDIPILSCPPFHSLFISFWWLHGSICWMSACLTSLHLSALMFGEDCCPRACLDKPIISYLHHGLSQALIFNLLLVSLWTHLLDVCVTFLLRVCGKDMSCTLYLIYSRLCWCLIHILILVFSSALTWLTHIILVVPILRLPHLHVAQSYVCCKC